MSLNIHGLICATVQCVGLMEQYMAESASNYLKNPSKQSMVVLAGSAHIENRYGVPDRITRCLGSTHLLHTLTNIFVSTKVVWLMVGSKY